MLFTGLCIAKTPEDSPVSFNGKHLIRVFCDSKILLYYKIDLPRKGEF